MTTEILRQFHTPSHYYETVSPHGFISDNFQTFREDLFSKDYKFDQDYLTNTNGFFHNIYLGWYAHPRGRCAYVGTLDKFPYIVELADAYLSATESGIEPLISIDSLAQSIQDGTRIFYNAAKIAPEGASEEHLTPIEFSIVDTICDTANIASLDRRYWRTRMFRYVTKTRGHDILPQSPQTLVPNQYTRQGSRPEEASRRAFASGADYYMPGTSSWKESSRRAYLADGEEPWVALSSVKLLLQWASQPSLLELDYREELEDYRERMRTVDDGSVTGLHGEHALLELLQSSVRDPPMDDGLQVGAEQTNETEEGTDAETEDGESEDGESDPDVFVNLAGEALTVELLRKESSCPICYDEDAPKLGNTVIVLSCCGSWFCPDCLID